jgi:catechol 2,3-dioxygenase-like lactoylglutathione lyase family enzyme
MSSNEPVYALDHVGFGVRDSAAARAFFAAALAPLGFGILMEFGDPPVLGIGLPGKPQVWIHQAATVTAVHVAFHAADRGRVDAFHQAALAAGGVDNGRPGLRPQYHPSYYAAYVRDADGNNIEAVCHAP